MSARGLPAREIGDVPEQSADRRPQDMEDVETPVSFAAVHFSSLNS